MTSHDLHLASMSFYYLMSSFYFYLYIYTMSHKSGATKEQKNTSLRNVRAKEITLTCIGPAFFVDHTWTDSSGLMVAAG